MTSAGQLLRDLSSAGIAISRRGENIKVEAKTGAVTLDIRRTIAANKAALIGLLLCIDEQRKRLRALAREIDVSAILVDGLSESDVDECSSLSDNALRSLLSMLAENSLRESGGIPVDETAVMICSRCGPVWTAPEIAAVMSRSNGWPRAIGCAWCHIRQSGLPVPRPP